MIVYKITNKNNGLAYIGRTVGTVNKRLREHLTPKKKSYFSNSLRKYGIKDFVVQIIDKSDDIDILNEKEEYWISYYNTIYPKGYNMTYGGEGNVRSKETCDKISRAKIGKKRPEDSVRKMVETRRNNGTFKHSDEQRKKYSLFFKKNNPMNVLEARRKIIETKRKNGTLKNSEETRRKISESLKGRPSGFKGKSHTEDTKQKNRLAHLGKHHTAESRKKMSLVHLGKHHTMEARRKLKAAWDTRKQLLRQKHSP